MIALDQDDVHLWLVDCQDADASRDSAMLSQRERQRSRTLRPDLVAAFVAQRIALRKILAAYLDIAAERIGITHDDRGKPMLAADETGLGFNQSHSGRWLLIGIARGRRIGVDVQIERPAMRCLDLARRFFAPEEADALAQLEADDQSRLFFAMWTMKEARLKATGAGIAGGLNQYPLPIADGSLPRVIQINDPLDGMKWTLQRLDVGDGIAAAAAIEGAGVRLRCARWRPESVTPQSASLCDGFG